MLEDEPNIGVDVDHSFAAVQLLEDPPERSPSSQSALSIPSAYSTSFEAALQMAFTAAKAL
jgi:hypothetical protein